MKFGDNLSGQLTPEWRFQYLQYEEAKQMILNAKENTPSLEDSDIKAIETHLKSERDKFFAFLQKEVTKVNQFFLEKLNEARRVLSKHEAELTDLKNYKNAAKIGQVKKQKSKTNEHDLKLAFSEFYLSLIFLQNFQQLNTTAFRKILKKYDKIFTTKVGEEWRQAHVLTADFATNNQPDELIKHVENIVTNELESGNHKKAMKRLRVPPLGGPEHRQGTIFRIGFFIGILLIMLSIILIAVTMISVEHSRSNTFCNLTDLELEARINSSNVEMRPPLSTSLLRSVCLFNVDHWETGLRLFRGMLLLSFMVVLIGINVYGWRASGVNHVLIFELDPRNHLSGLAIVEFGLFLATITTVFVTLWILLPFVTHNEIAEYITRYLALAEICSILVFMCNPLPIMMYSSRIWLLKVLFKVFTAPFHYVRFADFWMADQMNSIVPLFVDVPYIVCFYVSAAPSNETSAFCEDDLLLLSALISCLPAWFRFAQCWRRWYDCPNDAGKKTCYPHLVNAGKYSTAFIVITFKSLNSTEDSNTADVITFLWLISLLGSTCYTYTWDVKEDWGLFKQRNRHEDNFLLRDQIIYRYKAYYYAAIILDFLLRFAWTVQISLGNIGTLTRLESEALKVCLTFVEMLRRFVWNFFRLENEQLNNCGKFRAVRDISIKPISGNDLSDLYEMMDAPNGVNDVRIRHKKTIGSDGGHHHAGSQLTAKFKDFIAHAAHLPTVHKSRHSNEQPPHHSMSTALLETNRRASEDAAHRAAIHMSKSDVFEGRTETDNTPPASGAGGGLKLAFDASKKEKDV